MLTRIKPTSGARRSRRRRGPGRPAAQGASEERRELLLDAAVRCYARLGVAATRTRDVAAAADVTPALVNYYFGGKARLLRAAIEQRLMPVFASMRLRVESAGEAPAGLAAAFVEGIHGAVARHPWLPALWVREVLSEGGRLRGLVIERLAPTVPRVLARRFARAQHRGALNPALDPRLLVVSLVGLTLFPLAAAAIWRRVFDAADIDAAALARHTLALLENGMEGHHAR